MPDYKMLYHKIFNAVTDAQRHMQVVEQSLRAAQQECEELYLQSEPNIKAVPFPEKENK